MEVDRTRPAERGKQGKSDRLERDRRSPGRAPGRRSDHRTQAGMGIEPLRVLSIARRSALKAQQAAWRQIGALLITSSAVHLATATGAHCQRRDSLPALANTRPAAITDSVTWADTRNGAALTPPRRHRDLREQTRELARPDAAPGPPRPTPPCWPSRAVGPVIGTQLLITAGDNPDRLRSEVILRRVVLSRALSRSAPDAPTANRHRLSRGCNLIADNYGTHKSPAIKAWLAAHPRLHMHYTPTYSSWLNQVERWFADPTNDLLQRGDHRSVPSPRSRHPHLDQGPGNERPETVRVDQDRRGHPRQARTTSRTN